MLRLITLLQAHWAQARAHPDRGEFGPIAYTIMVSAMVVLALVVVAWGDNIANEFMSDVGNGDGEE